MTDDRRPSASLADEEIEVLEDDLLEEATLDAAALDEGGFDEEATQVFDPDADDDGGFEEEATQVFDPSEEGELDATDDGGFDEEATQVFEASSARSTAPMGGALAADARSRAASRPVSDAPPSVTVSPSASASTSSLRPVAAAAPVREPVEEATVVTTSPLTGQQRAPVRQVAASAARPAAPARSNTPLIIAAVLLAGVLVALLLNFGRGGEEPAAATATLGIFTAPSNAAILVDGRPLEQRTPTSVPDLQVGQTYEIELRADGYEPLTDTIQVAAAGPIAREYELQPILGTLVVRTFPEGATVSLDGEQRGESPITVEELDRQHTYTLSAVLDGHETVERSVQWDDATPNEQVVVLTLTPVLDEAEIEAAADDEDATEEDADDEPVAAAPAPARSAPARTTRPAPAPSAPPAEEAARARHLPATPPSERPSARPSERPSERPSARAPEPAPTPAPAAAPTFGQLSVQALPYGQVYVNNRMIAAETPLIGHRLETGVHTVKVYYVSLRQWSDERTVRIDADQNRVLTFRAEP